MDKHAYAFIGWPGQEIERFEIPWNGEVPAAGTVQLKGPAVENGKGRFLKATRGAAPGDVKEVSAENGMLIISVVPFNVRAGFSVTVGSLEIGRDEFTIHTRTADDKFERLEEGRVLYRLYTPEAKGPRPLILFLHGGASDRERRCAWKGGQTSPEREAFLNRRSRP